MGKEEKNTAGEKKQPVRRQQSPQRVQQAAQAMQYSSSSGVQRGYIPQNTGGYRPPEYPDPRQQAFYRQQPQTGQNTGGMQYVSSTGGGTRGFVMQDNTGSVHPAQESRTPDPSHKKTVIRLVLLIAAVIAAAAGVFILTENNKKAEVVRKDQRKIAQMQDELARYDNLYLPGVRVDGIDLGGMTPEQAKNTIQSQIQQRNDSWSVTLTYQGNPVVTYTAASLGMAVNTDEVLNKAWEPGHFGTLEERYETMLRLQEEPYEDYTARPSGDNSKIDRDLAEIKRQLDRKPADATVSDFLPDQEEPFIYTDEVYGMELDTDQLKTQLYHMVSTMESGTVEIVPEMIEPAVKRADLEKMYQKRSSVITPIDRHSPDNRNENIRLAFSRINGYRLDPGKTFSFNKVVGSRTTKNGFKTATEYVYGEHVEGVGGGVCQASTTVFQAALLAGLEIRERHAHSDYVSYTGYGKDATVSDTKGHEKDMRFRNTTDYPIYIQAEVTEDPTNNNRLICKVTIYGIDMENVRYELKADCIEILSPPLEPQYIKDKNAEYVTYKDQQKKVSEAKEGYVYKAYLIRYENDVEMDRKELWTDTYKAQPEKIYVGVSDREE